MVLQYVNAVKWPILTGFILLLFKAEASALLARLKSVDLNAAGASAKANFEDQATRTADSIEAAVEAVGTPSKPVVEEIDSRIAEPAGESVEATAGPHTPDRARVFLVKPGRGVRAAGTLSKAEREEIAGLARRLIAYSIIMGRRRQDSDGPPAATIDIRMHRIEHSVASIRAVTHPDHDLWPGVPTEIAVGYYQLRMLRIDARPESVTLEALSEFNRAAITWSKEYGEFILQAIEGADELEKQVHDLTTTEAVSPAPSVG